MRDRDVLPGRRFPAWLTALVIAIGMLGVFSATAAAEPAKFWGVDPQAAPSLQQLEKLRAGGVDTLRIQIAWGETQPEPSRWDWAASDHLVGAAANAGIEVLPVLSGAPEWAVKQVPVSAGANSLAPMTLPAKTGAQRSAWSLFVKEAVHRYGPNGDFWTENPNLTPQPIRTWQIWNEPNFKYFVARPNPAEYGKLVKISFSAIRSVDSGGQLILAGLFAEPKEGEHRYKNLKPRPAYFATEFLEKMYASNPGIKSKFSGIALHPYTRNYARLTPTIEKVRQVLKEAGDPNKGLWITELGWSSQPPTQSNLFAKGPQGQVTQLKNAFKLLEQKAAAWHVKRVFWFSIDDQDGLCNFCNGTGLFSEGFVPKPSWPAYVKFAGGTP
jgi:hypothetical protein